MVRNTNFNGEEYNRKMNNLKRNLTLDLQLDNADNKRKINSLMMGNAVLSSPDVKKCNMSTPDMEQFLVNHVLQTPTPNTTSHLLYSNELDALNDFQNDSSRSIHVELPKSSSSSNSSISNFMNLDNQYPTALYNSLGMSPDSVVIKDEPQTVPSLNSTPPVSPINMESQEKIKLERKRMRNRVAASKCRKRKLERIAKLEEKVKCLKNENTELGNSAIKLRNEIYELKEKVMKHFNHGCKILIPPGL